MRARSSELIQPLLLSTIMIADFRTDYELHGLLKQQAFLARENGSPHQRTCERTSERGSTSHHETQGSQDTLTHFVIPRSTLPSLHGQFKLLGRIFCEECGHLPGQLCTVDRDID